MPIHPLRLFPGQDLKQSIETFARQEKLQAAWVCSAVGSLTQMNLRFANRNEGYKRNGFFELVSLSGTVSINGVHLHAALSDENGQTMGGHLLYENMIYTTAEIILQSTTEWKFVRETDGTTPWPELQIIRC